MILIVDHFIYLEYILQKIQKHKQMNNIVKMI